MHPESQSIMDRPPQASNGEPPVRVLVVDDEADTLDLARMLLEPRGYEVATALDGREGLAKAQSGTFDVIVTDVTMPHMDGIALGNALRVNPNTRSAGIIVHSADGPVR